MLSMIISIIIGICLGGLIIFGPSACADLMAEWCARPFDEKVCSDPIFLDTVS